MSVGLRPGEAAEINEARERFAAGSQDLDGIRPSIALSWARCRDHYGVDPRLELAPPALDPSHRCLDRDVLLTGLGGHAAALRQRFGTGVVTVVDGGGQMVGSWGGDVPGAGEAHLRPWYSWSEMSSGTNGMGTALETQTLSAVRGPEHWCEGFHALDCLGAPIIDPVTGVSLAAVNVSTVTGSMPDDAPDLLRRTTALVRATLSTRAEGYATTLATAFSSAVRGRRGAVLAVDTGGNVVVASSEAGQLLGLEAWKVRADPAGRVPLDGSGFRALAAKAAHAAHGRPGWSGSVTVFPAGAVEGVEATLVAVHHGCHPLGFLMTLGDARGEPITLDHPEGLPGHQASRVVAHRQGRTLVLRPAEIQYAEANGNSVWLATDRGRARAAHRGLKNLEHTLEAHGFLRVHRRYLVNLARVVEVERSPDGELKLLLDVGRTPAIPVARAHTPAVRRQLGL